MSGSSSDLLRPIPNDVRLLPILTSLASTAALLAAPAVDASPLARATWLKGVEVTEYYPVPEDWFTGARVAAPGLEGEHRVDWLYSARGVVMEGDGIGLDGKRYHLESGFGGGWVNASGKPTRPRLDGNGWSRGRPFWRNFGWRTKTGRVTFPIEAANGSLGWWDGTPVRERPVAANLSFGTGPSRRLRFYRSVAVDTRLIPLGSRVFVRAYCGTVGRGWAVAADTGSAIIGRHIDMYRRPPKTAADQGQRLDDQRILVIPPGARAPRRLPRC